MDRNNLNLKELKSKKFNKNMIILLTEIALDSSIKDEQFDLCISSGFTTDKELKLFYDVLQQINKLKYDISDDIKNILIKDPSIRETYFSFIKFSDKNYQKYNSILDKYYDPKYKEKGIELLKYLISNNSYAEKIGEDLYNITLTINEIEVIYKLIVQYCQKYDFNKEDNTFYEMNDYIEDSPYSEIEIFDLFIKFCCKAKINKEDGIVRKSISEKKISTIKDIIFESEKIQKEYYKKYYNQLEVLLEFYIDKNVSYSILKNYLGCTLDKDSIIQHICKDVSDNNPQFKDHIDKFIYMIQTFPNGWYNSYDFEMLFRFRHADKERLRILFDPSNTKKRVDWLCSDLIGRTRCRIEGFDNTSCSTKLNSISIKILQEFFDPLYINIDIAMFGDYLIYAEYNSNEDYINLLFNYIKKLLVSADIDEQLHYKVTRLMYILLYRNDNRYGRKEDDSKFINMIKLLSTKENINKQYINIKESNYYNERISSIGLYSSLYEVLDWFYCKFNKSDEEILEFYDKFNSSIKEHEIGTPKNKTTTNIWINTIKYVFENVIDDEDSEYSDHLSEIIKKYKDNLTIERLELYCKLYDKLDDKYSYNCTTDTDIELLMGILILDPDIVEKQVKNTISKKDTKAFESKLSYERLGLYGIYSKKLKEDNK